jgi:type I restriction-modification system DNA methylase subunit
MDKERMKAEITNLIEKYNREKAKRYNEEATKNDFILPLFKILGWNTEDSNEVSKEENISGKRVDYGFRIDGIPKFFLEAKGLDEDLEGSRLVKGRQVTYAEQAINYAYYKGCNWAILTNFKGIIVYDAWAKAKSQSSFRFAIWVDSLLSDFESVYLLSKEAFGQGLLDKKYSTKSRKRPITEQLLLDFTNFRAILSKDVYTLNKSKNLTEEELDEAIQRLFDRLIFIRNCEDRELEPYELLSTLRQWKESRKGTLVGKLRELFVHFDDTYNSKIFSKHLCDQVDISDNVLSRILDGLYTTEDGSILYDFSLIDADVLGNIYEQYLGHILKKTEKRTKLTESKAKRKEEGIYYTPSYIVDYIVRNTVGELVKNKKTDVSKIKVLDPACGSGSFLIKTFDVLNEYHSKKESYSQNKLDMSGTGTTYSTKLSILKDNIFGVDLDKQAVDIAQLNLLLKVAEKKRRLPILQQNVKNGNSLIDDPSLAGDKAFKWNEEFAEIMGNGGFDVVVGNPPYVNIYLLSKNEKEIEYYQKTYFGAYKKFDLYVLFIEKAIRLLKDGGYFSFIVPDKFLLQPYGERLRQFIVENCCIIKIVDLTKYKIFTDATVDNVIIVLRKNKNKEEIDKNKIKIVRPTEDPKDKNGIEENVSELKQSIYSEDEAILFRLDVNPTKMKLKVKIETGSVLVKDICYVNWGARSGDIKNFVLKEKINDLCKPMLDGRDINRYTINYDEKYLLYDIKKLYNPMFKELFENPKIIIRDVNAKEGIKATLDTENYYTEHTLSVCLLFFELAGIERRGLNITREQMAESKKYDIRYILAVLNSKLITFYFKTFIGSGLHVYPDNVRALPIKIISETEQKKIAGLVDKRLSLQKQFNNAHEKRTDANVKIENEIIEVENEIDNQIYKLYGITEEEKKVIEESLK